MNCLFTKSALTILLAAAAIGYCGVGQSSVITLVFPYGARSYAMGEVGTALADDESVLYYNPAGLVRPNKRFQGGTGSFYFQPIVPAFKQRDLWQTAISGNYQDSSFWFQPGFFWNYLSMGVNTWTDDLGKVLGMARSYEKILALGFGMDFRDIGINNHSFGLTAKYVRSALIPGFGDPDLGVGRTYAIDFGYLWDIGKGFRLGTTFMNMGPAIYCLYPDKSDPIPFTINLAVAYQNGFDIKDFPFFTVAGELRLDREVVKNYYNTRPDPFYVAIWTDLLHNQDESLKMQLWSINEHLGGEIAVMNTAALRFGWLVDLLGERYEFHWGVGIMILNHFSLGWGYMYSPKGYMRSFARLFDPDKSGASGARHGQWQISLTGTRLLTWNLDDFTWWRIRR